MDKTNLWTLFMEGHT